MEITFLGACREVGKSCFLVKTKDVRLMLDCGIKIHGHNETPLLTNVAAEAVVVTHAHLDHSGSLPVLYKHHPIPCFTTFPTIPLVNLLIEDSEKVALLNKQSVPFSKQDVKRLEKHYTPLPYEQEYEFHDGTTISLHDAGHILGSAQVLIRDGKTVLYTGDIKIEKTRMHDGAKAPNADVEVMIMESTYGTREHPDRKKLEKQFREDVQNTVDNGLTAIIPSFAVGRAQEMAMMLDGINADIYMDGMAKAVSSITTEYPNYIRNGKALNDALKKIVMVEGNSDKRRAMGKGKIIITTSGMMDGGPVLSYLKALNGRCAIFMTGYQVPGSNGSALLHGEKLKLNGNYTKINAPVKQYDFSAHAGKSDLIKYAKKINPEKIFCVHGDSLECQGLAEELKAEGFDADVPENNEKLILE